MSNPIKAAHGPDYHVIFQDELAYSMVAANPSVAYEALVAAKRQVINLSDLTAEESLSIYKQIERLRGNMDSRLPVITGNEDISAITLMDASNYGTKEIIYKLLPLPIGLRSWTAPIFGEQEYITHGREVIGKIVSSLRPPSLDRNGLISAGICDLCYEILNDRLLTYNDSAFAIAIREPIGGHKTFYSMALPREHRKLLTEFEGAEASGLNKVIEEILLRIMEQGSFRHLYVALNSLKRITREHIHFRIWAMDRNIEDFIGYYAKHFDLVPQMHTSPEEMAEFLR